ncbi:enoyl-CoA hydratase/isomerase family protein [Microbacterium sp.]|uniref:enoyl-CoA hydratase/isomerase family protein n=1 Tax=Microbacterium sp. TaxID=51671 RepID=UPI003A95B0F5
MSTADGTCLIVTVRTRGRRNALALADWRAIGTAFRQAAEQEDVGVAVICSSESGVFSAGADISEFPQRRFGDSAHDYNRAISSALDAITGAPFPVVAAVDGMAIGGGCEIVAACDLRLATVRASFGVPIGRLGVILGPSEQQAIVRAIGPGRAFALIATGRIVDAGTASDWGLIHEVCEAHELMSLTAERALGLLRASRASLRATKELLQIDADDDLTIAFRRREASVYAGAELREGVDAFLSKRSPRFAAAREEGK